MGFSQDEGYTPKTIVEILTEIVSGINTQFGTTYTYETFIGTNFFKFFYALAQRVQANEIKTSEIVLKLQDYFDTTNEFVLQPKTTPTGMIQALKAATTIKEDGYTASIAPVEAGTAGTCMVCVDVDDTSEDPPYADMKLEICTLLSQYIPAGIMCDPAATETETIVLSNGQSFDFGYILPTNPDPEVLLRLTLTTSRNNQAVIQTPDEIKATLIANIAAEYGLGKDFAPERYFSVSDAPWCSDILLEYSLDDGSNWLTDVYEATYDELFVILLANITLVEV